MWYFFDTMLAITTITLKYHCVVSQNNKIVLSLCISINKKNNDNIVSLSPMPVTSSFKYQVMVNKK